MLGDVLLATLSAEALPKRIPIKGIHSTFLELSGMPKYGRLLSSLAFVMGPDVAVSEELETALFRLCSCGLCTVDNPDFRYLRIEPESRTAMQRVLQRHLESDPEKLKELQDLSKEFHQKVEYWIEYEERKLSLRGLSAEDRDCGRKAP